MQDPCMSSVISYCQCLFFFSLPDVFQWRLKYLIQKEDPPSLKIKTLPRAVYSSTVISISCNYPQEGYLVCHTVESYAKVESASQSSQAVSHCASLKLLNALLIPMLPWLRLVNPVFVSL